MTPRKRLHLVVLLALPMLGALLARRPVPASEPPRETPRVRERVRIGYLPIAASLPLYVALEKGLFDGEGIEPELTRFASSDALGEAGAAGRLDVLGSLALNVAFDCGLETKKPFRLFCANEYSDRPGEIVDHLVVRKGSGIARLEDLKGKRIAAFPGSVTRILVFGVLAKHGLGERDVVYTELSPKDWRPALEGGSVDAAFVMEPQATEILESGAAASIVSGFIARLFPDAPSRVTG